MLAHVRRRVCSSAPASFFFCLLIGTYIGVRSAVNTSMLSITYRLLYHIARTPLNIAHSTREKTALNTCAHIIGRQQV